jgi:hypothetical protein
MASLLILLNRAVSYFNKSNNEINNTDRERSEISTDDEVMLMNDDDASIYVYLHISIPQNYNFERERCNDCCLLTQDGEKQCVVCKEFKHITLYEPRTGIKCKQCANAWRKIKKYCDSCKCVVQWGSWRYHIKSKKHQRNMSS